MKYLYNTFFSAMLFLACISYAHAADQGYQSFGDTDSVIQKEQSQLPGASTSTTQSSPIISNTASSTQFPTASAVDQAAASALKFFTAAKVAALSAVAVAAVSILTNSTPTSQH